MIKDELSAKRNPFISMMLLLGITAFFSILLLAVSLVTTQLFMRDLWRGGLLVCVVSTFLMTVCFYLFFRAILLRQSQKTNHLHSLLLDHAGQGIFAVAADGEITFANPAAEKIIGYSRKNMTGKKMHPLIHHHHRNGNSYPESDCPLYLTLKDGLTRHVTDEVFWHVDGTAVEVDYIVAALHVKEKIIGGVVIFSDITEGNQQQVLLRQREQSLAQAQELAQLGSWRFSMQQSWSRLDCSDECYRILGAQPGSDIRFASLARMIHREDRGVVYNRWRALLQGKVSDTQYRVQIGDNIKWLHERAEVQQAEDGSLYCVGAVLDITKVKNKEAQLRRSKQHLREMVAHREQALESERAHIAREVHDELGQQLTALRMDTTMLKLRYAEPSIELDAHILRMKEAIDSCILSVRYVASSLRPAVLDMGLIEAVDWLLKNFSKRTGVTTVFNAPADKVTLDEARAIAVFRVLQESLTNITRHAQASNVKVRLYCKDQVLHINVVDDGKGFDLKVVRNKHGFGLMGMRERVLMFGGQASFDSIVGQGTTVMISIPLC